MQSWTLSCSSCEYTARGDALAAVCTSCGQPLLVRYAKLPSRESISPRWDMWRYSSIMPLADEEQPVSLGEGGTPLIEAPTLASELGIRKLWIKDEGLNPTASFKARGMSAAVTRAAALKVPGLVAPTAGNAGAALAAYGAAARVPVRVFAPATTPPAILNTIRAFGATLDLVDGHIGDAGKRARAFSAESGYFDVSTLREPYRIEGKKTMGVELAEQLGWRLPDVIIYPTGGGTGLIGMWKVFEELRDAGWIGKGVTPAHGHRAGGWLRPHRARVRERRGESHALGEPCHARGWSARSGSAWRQVDSARSSREQGGGCFRERAGDFQRDGADWNSDGHRCGSRGRLRPGSGPQACA